MDINLNLNPKEFRRELRKNSTPAEKALWKLLRNFSIEGRKFRRQHSIGPFIADFCCVAEKLVIELDGEVHFNPEAQAYDQQRDEFLKQEEWQVLRFENKEVFEEQDAVLYRIRQHFEQYQSREM